MARRATLIAVLRRKNPNTLVFDAGNWGDMNPRYGKIQSDFIFKLMQRMGYDAVTFGIREYKFGIRHYEELALGSPVVLMSNVRENRAGKSLSIGRQVFIRDVGGVLVGAFSLVRKNILAKGKENTGNFEAEDVFMSGERITGLLKIKGCEIIVLLAQMEPFVAKSVVERVPDIDVVILGHHPGIRTTYKALGNAIFMHTGVRGTHVGHLDLEVAPSGKIINYNGGPIPLDERVKKDSSIQALVKEMNNKIKQIEKRK